MLHTGIEKAKAKGVYTERKPDAERNRAILTMLDKGASWSTVCSATGASRSTLSLIIKNRESATS
ncbi:hypothetical protein [Paraburkholderia sediminicola]|uniref:hypothetical protein n=1 Tax=Paraburkholderia sediminicola TaxID=458836 RepID=UPI0038B979FE